MDRQCCRSDYVAEVNVAEGGKENEMNGTAVTLTLSIYNSRWCRWLGTATSNGISNGRGEFDGMEYWVYARHGVGKAETVSQMANLAFDNIWSKILVR